MNVILDAIRRPRVSEELQEAFRESVEDGAIVVKKLTAANARIKELEARLKPLEGIDDVESWMEKLKYHIKQCGCSGFCEGDCSLCKALDLFPLKKDEAKNG